jgi:hypothetical protein
MELKLNIYKSRKSKEIEKTLTANDFELSTGVCEDVIKIINIDLFTGADALSEESQLIELFKIVSNSFDVFKEMLMEVFEDLTEEDISRTKLSEIVGVVYKIIRFALGNLFSSFGSNSKN